MISSIAASSSAANKMPKSRGGMASARATPGAAAAVARVSDGLCKGWLVGLKEYDTYVHD